MSTHVSSPAAGDGELTSRDAKPSPDIKLTGPTEPRGVSVSGLSDDTHQDPSRQSTSRLPNTQNGKEKEKEKAKTPQAHVGLDPLSTVSKPHHHAARLTV